MMITNRQISLKEMEKVYPFLVKDFNENEVRPFSNIEFLYNKGIYKGYGCFEEDKMIGFAFMVMHEDNVILDYLEIIPEYQSKGYGSLFLKQLLELFSDALFFVEVEHVEDDVQQRRMDFYLRNNLIHTHVEEILWYVHYDILCNKVLDKNIVKDKLFSMYSLFMSSEILKDKHRYL